MTHSNNGEASQAITTTYELLGNRRRLLTIKYLSLFDYETAVDVRQIARLIRAVEINKPPREVGTSEYESAYNSLIQVHLPKLATEGVIQYDSDRKIVTTTRKTVQCNFLIVAGEMFTE